MGTCLIDNSGRYFWNRIGFIVESVNWMGGREGGWIDSTELGFLCLLITLVLEMLLEALWHVE